jgi:hypothetical protein
LQLPRPTAPSDALPSVWHEVSGDRILLHLPKERHERVTSKQYRTDMMPNARLAGLLRKEKGEDGLALAPFVFAEISLPNAEPGRTPRLHSKLSNDRYVFCWDRRRNCGYLLATPSAHSDGELSFRVEWCPAQEPAAAEIASAGGEP